MLRLRVRVPSSAPVWRGTQMVRERIANPLCAGSSPVHASNADIAQLVEFLPSKQIVEGSSPFVRSKERILARSTMVQLRSRLWVDSSFGEHSFRSSCLS
jgi:hypothetical protein